MFDFTDVTWCIAWCIVGVTFAIIAMVQHAILRVLIREQKETAETYEKREERFKQSRYEFGPAKLQVLDKVYDRHGIEYTVDHVYCSLSCCDEYPSWTYWAIPTENFKISSLGFVESHDGRVSIEDKDIGVKYFVKMTHTVVEQQWLIEE